MNLSIAPMVTALALSFCGDTATQAAPPAAPAGVSGDTAPASILATMKAVADWQLAQPPRLKTDDWTVGALYAGVMALSQVSDSPKYHDAMMTMGRNQEWKPAKRVYDADDHCVCQTYLELYLQHRDPAMLGPTRKRFDSILANPRTNDLRYVKGSRDRWSWCDALFMGPPAWLRLYVATSDKKYLDFMDREWWNTSGYLYDKEEHLYFRDSNYFDKREANGKKVFWSRGNGWVLAGRSAKSINSSTRKWRRASPRCSRTTACGAPACWTRNPTR
jgi:unsaturated rhamnogalacturonyl hydrolase